VESNGESDFTGGRSTTGQRTVDASRKVGYVRVSVPVAGGALSAEDTGGGGTPVVLVHADWTDSGIWAALVPRLRDRYRVIRYDLRGFGRSARPAEPFTRLGDLLAVLDHFGIEEAVLAGHSGGGGTALGLAVHHPERVRALALIAPGIHDYPWPADDPFYTECGALIAAGDRDGLLRLGTRVWAPAGADDAIRAMMSGAVASWFEIGDLEEADPPVFGRLGEVRRPAVMLVGDLEYPMVAAASRAIAARLDGSRSVLVPGADHLLPLRDPDRLAEAIAGVAGLPR
jgi:3-oxoadipate enol-lactonase